MALESAPVIYGTIIDQDSWDGWEIYEGVYSFTAEENPQITPVFTDAWDLAATAGGALVGDTYHVFYYNIHRGYVPDWISFTSFKIKDWSIVGSCYMTNDLLSNDMTCDPTTGLIYCATSKDCKYALKTFDAELELLEKIGDWDLEIVAIASTADGRLYGVGTDGIFYSIDKATAALHSIGDTGVSPMAQQSAVFDYESGNLYWAAYTTDEKSALFTIDIETGHATKICDFDDNARFCGLYTLSSGYDDAVPLAPSSFKAQFDNGSNDGIVSFNMPTRNNGGDTLGDQTIDYLLYVDHEVVASGSAISGESVVLSQTIATGQHLLEVSAANEAGEGPRAKLNQYVGKARPASVWYVLAELDDTPGQVMVSWEACDAHYPYDAYFDESKVRYTVVRQPDNITVAEEVNRLSTLDKIDYDGELKCFWYDVYVVCEGMTSMPTISNKVALGQPLTPPFIEHMVDTEIGLFTIIDDNHDGQTWGKDLSGYGVGCGGRWDGDCDDWLILPPLHLVDGGLYHTIIILGNDYDGHSLYEVWMGDAPRVEAMTTPIKPCTSTAEGFEQDITVDEPGTYYIGIRCLGKAGSTMYITDIIVRGLTDYNSPAAPTKVRGESAEDGELAAYVTFTTPSVSMLGDPLVAPLSANIYLGETLVGSMDDLQLNAEYSCKVPGDQGFNVYTVGIVNEYGEGPRKGSDYVFAGQDYPDMITNFMAHIDSDGHPVLTWDPISEIGMYGYYVNPDEVLLDIYRGYSDETYDLIVEEYQGTSYVDDDPYLEGKQLTLTYLIFPYNSIGMGYGSSFTVQIGLEGIFSVEEHALSVKAATGSIEILGAKNQTVEVYTLSSALAARVEAQSDYCSIAVAPGLYIVRVGQYATKLRVR